jgi:hypothetical protein
MHDPYLSPFVRQRAVSIGTSSPHSFKSNMAVVDGPAPAGNYYGVFLGEPPQGFPSSPSPGSGHRSLGTSDGSHYGGSSNSFDSHSKHSKHASVTFPVSAPTQPADVHQPRPRHTSIAVPPKTQVRESQQFYTIRAAPLASTRHANTMLAPAPAAQPVTLPSALKRERRSTICPSASTSSDCLPVSELRTTCKFTIGMIDECFKKV